MSKQINKVNLENFGLGKSKNIIHVLVAEVDSSGVNQRAWCGAPLSEESLPLDAKIGAYEIKVIGKKMCKRCSAGKGNQRAMRQIQDEIDKLTIDR